MRSGGQGVDEVRADRREAVLDASPRRGEPGSRPAGLGRERGQRA